MDEGLFLRLIRPVVYTFLVALVGALSTSCAADNLIDAAKGNQSDQIVKLLSQGADIKMVDGSEYTALHWAAFNGRLEAAKVLVEHGAAIDARDDEDATPMIDAIYERQTRVAAYLIEKGADINAYDHNYWTALMYAAWNRDAASTEMLIAHGADVNFRAAGKRATALSIARQYNAGGVADILKEHGAHF